MKIRPTVQWTYFPYFCGVTRNDVSLTITVSVDMIFFKDSVGTSLVRAAVRTHAAQLQAARDELAEARCAASQTSSTRPSTSCPPTTLRAR